MMEASSMTSRGSTDRNLSIMTAAFFMLLLSVLAIFGYTPTNDGDGYIELAWQCVAAGEPYPMAQQYMSQPFVWNPGAVNMVVLSLALTGSVVPLLVVMCALKALSALLTARIAQHMFGDTVAEVAFLIFALYPNNWGQSTTVLSEIPMIFCVLAAVFTMLRHNSCRALLLAGALTGVANWFRPVAPVFLVTMALYVVLLRRKVWLSSTSSLAAGFFLMVLVTGGMTYLRTGHFVSQSTSFWYNMADDAYDGATVDPHFGEELYKKGTPRYIEGRERMTCFQCAEIWKSRCMPWLMTHKVEYLKKIPGRLFYMYNGDHDNMAAFLGDKSKAENNYVTLPLRHLVSEYSGMTAVQRLALLSFVIYVLVMLSAAGGVVTLIRRREWTPLLMLLFVIVGGTFAHVLLVQGETRFKDPYMPFVMILSAVFLVSAADRMKARR